ncbi:uncharacterized protein LOC113375482 [Ctenocephalides felis]|uniref:uncharacterized protein LOC113375482 n=1 Tax=Ctenocephalides felis TaxID=7515 RepID=UPI000E6E3434|nr:uncharacterized protein LOC113375482 [Ctenocephalides felis]
MNHLREFVIVLIAVGAVAANYSPMYLRGAPVMQPRMAAARNTSAPPQCPSGKFGAMCHDCNTMLFCTGSTTPVTTITCRDNPSVPYCVNNQCTAVKNETDPTCGAGGTCSVNGYQPDPKDCSRYIYCNNGESTVYECPSSYVYDHSTNLCKKQSSPADCAVMNCTTPNSFVTYSPDKSIYAWCNERLEPTVLQCEDAVNEWFDVATSSCRIVCKKEGVFADRRDCTKYHQCFVVNGGWQIKNYQCPKGLYFEPKELRCVPGTCTPEITEAPPTTDDTTTDTGSTDTTTTTTTTTTTPKPAP